MVTPSHTFGCIHNHVQYLIDLPRWLPALIRCLQQSNQRSNATEISMYPKLLDNPLDYFRQLSRFALRQKPAPTAQLQQYYMSSSL